MADLRLKESDGFAFKNLSGTELLLPYEDWRLPHEVRAADLAGRLSLEQIAGLMLWSPHQMVPFVPGLPFKGHYDGGDFVPGVTDPAALTDEQKEFVAEENLRNFLLVAEFEKQADGILAHFGVENKIMMEILSGESEPGGRLPVLLPADMETVERHCEDVADDMEPYVDVCGNRYDYGFGLMKF